MAGVKQKTKQPPKQPPSQPHGAGITRAQLRRLLGISERQLRAYERYGWVEPPRKAPAEASSSAGGTDSIPSNQQAWYSFPEVSALRSILHLRRSGVPA